MLNPREGNREEMLNISKGVRIRVVICKGLARVVSGTLRPPYVGACASCMETTG